MDWTGNKEELKNKLKKQMELLALDKKKDDELTLDQQRYSRKFMTMNYSIHLFPKHGLVRSRAN